MDTKILSVLVAILVIATFGIVGAISGYESVNYHENSGGDFEEISGTYFSADLETSMSNLTDTITTLFSSIIPVIFIMSIMMGLLGYIAKMKWMG